MSHIPNAPASEAEKQERIQNALFNVGYNAEFSRRGAIKAALALAGSAVLFGLPGRAYAARARKRPSTHSPRQRRSSPPWKPSSSSSPPSSKR